jgi:hypothetical protein
MEDSMIYQEYSTLQKVEQLIKMIQRDDILKKKLLEGDEETKLRVLRLVGLHPRELEAVKGDLEETFGVQAASVWVPT